ncbi:MAG: TonB-dependent receptor [Saprospiraceae bacterium]|nr:TonB-dependent receptor [Saprospiraceae bacterium]
MKSTLLLFFTLALFSVTAQTQFTLSGYVKDGGTGETLIGANVFNLANAEQGTASNAYGFYSLTLPKGSYKIVFSYLGFQEQAFEVVMDKDLKLNVDLTEGITIEEIVVSAEKEERAKNVEGTQMGTVSLPVENIKKLPAIFGEVDLLKSIQLLPGVLSSGEGNAGFYVRGGGPDQNLVLLDEAVVYNSGHMLGFFSVFNADAIKNTTLIKGGMPANYGGRLSSVLDIQMKEGNQKEYSAEGGVGLISSRLTIQGPIVKDKTSFIVSGRRTYIGDLAQAALKGSTFEGTNYYFYDLNAKINHKFSDSDRLFFSAYFGRDVLKFRQPKRDFRFDLPYGNSTATLRWNHLFTNKLFFNLSAVYNDYQFQFGGGQDEFEFKLFSGVKDWNLKLDFDYFAGTKHNIKYGLNYTYHTLTPNTASATSGDVEFNTGFLPKYANEYALYFMDDIKVNNDLAINAGIRYSIFSQLGPYTSKLDSTQYGTFQPAITYTGIEPRVNFKYKTSDESSIKGGITFTNQYLHLVSNSSSTLPTDIWVPSTEIVKPQRGVQYAIGFFKNFKNDTYETSVEVYYRDLKNQIDYADDYVNDITQEVEDGFVYGKGRAYGAEFFLKKSVGKLNGWIGYTLSRTERSFERIENGRWYPAVYDRTHDLSVVVNYQLSKKWEFGGIFIYGTGKLFTPINGFFFTEQNLNLFYGPRNSQRLDDYHRMDISFTYTPNPDSKKKWRGSWNFSVYNLYNRKNPFFINYDINTDFEKGTTSIEGTKITIFPFIPSITYNFKFN